MVSQTKQKFFGAILLVSILIICIPLWLSSNHGVLWSVASKPPQAPDMPVINLDIPPMPQKIRASTSDSYMTGIPQTPPAIATKQTIQAQPLQSSWRLKLGNFSYQKNSTRLIKTLQQDGFEAYDEATRKPNGETVYQVFIGPAVSELEAVQLQKHLLHHLGMQSMIVAYPFSKNNGV